MAYSGLDLGVEGSTSRLLRTVRQQVIHLYFNFCLFLDSHANIFEHIWSVRVRYGKQFWFLLRFSVHEQYIVYTRTLAYSRTENEVLFTQTDALQNFVYKNLFLLFKFAQEAQFQQLSRELQEERANVADQLQKVSHMYFSFFREEFHLFVLETNFPEIKYTRL